MEIQPTILWDITKINGIYFLVVCYIAMETMAMIYFDDLPKFSMAMMNNQSVDMANLPLWDHRCSLGPQVFLIKPFLADEPPILLRKSQQLCVKSASST